ncbi:MAG TPA: hypothetical protein VEU33_19405 [Archangium sp.]|nr:hypothetical protein [Archangium sp.]
MRGEIPEFRERISRGEQASFGGRYARRPDPQYDPHYDNLAVLKRRWKAWTGLDAGDDLYMVGTNFEGEDVPIPRSALLALYDELVAMNQRRPWVPPTPPGPESEPTDESPDLLTRAELESTASGLDELDVTISDVDSAARASAKRRVLLTDLQRTGLLDEDRAEHNLRLVPSVRYPTLRGYIEAALSLHAYLRCPERQTLPDPAPFPIVGGLVALDWFRLGVPTPEGSTPNIFLSFCEDVFSLELQLQGDFEGGQGVIFTRAERWYELVWRKDDGIHPALLTAHPGAPH